MTLVPIVFGLATLASFVVGAPYEANGFQLLDDMHENMPDKCLAFYTTKKDETCITVVDQFKNFTATQLYKWNPEIKQTCYGIQSNFPLCINVAGYTYGGPFKPGDILPADATPAPIVGSIVPTCKKYEYIGAHGEGPGLDELLKRNSLDMDTFKTLNGFQVPAGQIPSLWAGYWHCIGN